VPRVATDTRWTWIFGTILILVVIVVIAFLLGITSALSSIDDALGTTDSTLQEVGGEAKPLPEYIKTINQNLTNIDTALKPIPNQAGKILASLTSIDQSAGRINAALGNTSSSLVNTSGSLVNTSGDLSTITSSLQSTSGSLIDTTNILVTIRGSLVNTSGVLVSVSSRVKAINAELHAARSASSAGTAAVPPEVTKINADLVGAEGGNAVKGDGGLFQTNLGLRATEAHLTSICNSTLLGILPPAKC
jgi:methyl-accepting chemotaxis protein